jgi:hypothetical protein
LTAIAAGGYGLQRLVVPWLREYYERWAAARQDGKDPAAGKRTSQALTAEEQGSANALADAIKVGCAPSGSVGTTVTRRRIGALSAHLLTASQQPSWPAAAEHQLQADVQLN